MAVQVQQVQKPQFKTSDGKLFEEEGAALRHEVTIGVDKSFAAFRERSGYADKAYNCILAWELHKEGLLKPRKNGATPETPVEPTAAPPQE